MFVWAVLLLSEEVNTPLSDWLSSTAARPGGGEGEYRTGGLPT